MKEVMHAVHEQVSGAAYRFVNKGLKRVRRSAPVAIILASPMAHAKKLSDLTDSWTTETAAMVKVVLFVIAGIGILTSGFSVISWIMAVKRQEPAKWQLWGALGGGAAVVVPVLVLAFAGSITGEEDNSEQVFSDMGLDY